MDYKVWPHFTHAQGPLYASGTTAECYRQGQLHTSLQVPLRRQVVQDTLKILFPLLLVTSFIYTYCNLKSTDWNCVRMSDLLWSAYECHMAQRNKILPAPHASYKNWVCFSAVTWVWYLGHSHIWSGRNSSISGQSLCICLLFSVWTLQTSNEQLLYDTVRRFHVYHN